MIRTRLLAPGLGSILAAVVIWGTMPFIINVASRELLPGELVTVRMLLAGALLTAATGPRRLYEAIRHNFRFLMTLSLVGFGLPNLLYVYALRTAVPVPVLSFISNSYPAWAIALAVIFLHERPSAHHLIGVGCALAGLYLMSGVSAGSRLDLPLGMVLALLASLGWASGSVVSKKLTATVDATALSAARHVLSGIVLCPVMLAEGMHLAQAGLRTWLAMGLLVALSVLSYLLYYRGLARTSVSSASLIETLGSVVTWGIGVTFFGQGLSPVQGVAACLILAGTVLVTVRDVRLLKHPRDC